MAANMLSTSVLVRSYSFAGESPIIDMNPIENSIIPIIDKTYVMCMNN